MTRINYDSSCEVVKQKEVTLKTKAVAKFKRMTKFASYGLKYTWTLFLRSKDETPEVLKDFPHDDPKKSSSPNTTAPIQQELDLLFGPSYNEFFNAGTSRVNKSSSPTVNSAQQDTHPSTNIHPTSETSTPTNVHADKNNDNQADDTEHEFTNPLYSEYRWTKDHPLTQVHGDPSKPVQTRRQLATDPEMCMFALTVSTAEPKNIKEAMADSTWIEAMQEELHQFDRL
ncbi:hypothetical protein Tco_1466510 [Tanacetum coccineum]